MLTQVADGVWVRQSEWVWTNSIVVRGQDGLILVDPGIEGPELDELADDLDRLGVPLVAGFSTHPHWDHLLWHDRFGDAALRDRCRNQFAGETLELQKEGHWKRRRTGRPSRSSYRARHPAARGRRTVSGEIIEHQAHAPGHAAVLLADRGVLLAGDMLSDILLPIFDSRQDDQLSAYETALDRLAEAVKDVDVMVPGHGAVATGPEVAARVAADRAYIDALRREEEPVDARMEEHDWLSGIHESNLAQTKAR